MAFVMHEVGDQRRHRRSTVPIELRIQSVAYTPKDWSLGGFRVDDYFNISLAVGDRQVVEVAVVYHGLEVKFATEVEVVRLTDARTLAARFIHLPDREKEVLAHVMVGPTSNGERASLIKALARVDVVVTPPSTVPTPRESPEPNRMVGFVRRTVWSLVYWGTGLVLGLLIVTILYFHAFQLDLEYSVVTLPLYPVLSQDVGRCAEVMVAEGDLVRAGQPVLRMEDDVLSRDLEIAELQLAAARSDLDTANVRVKKELEKVASYKKITRAKLNEMNALVDATAGQLAAATQVLARSRSTAGLQANSLNDVNQWESQVAFLSGQLILHRAERAIYEAALEAIDEHGSFYDQRHLVGDLAQYLVNQADARQRVEIAERRVAVTRERIGRLVYRAPFDGRVVRLLKQAGATANRGEAVAVIEQGGVGPVIDAFATQDEANSLAVGGEAAVYIPALDKAYRGRVVKIDRTSGFLTEMQSHMKDYQLRYNWRGQQDRSAYVQIEIAEDLTAEARAELAGGMPATVAVATTPGVVRRARDAWTKVTGVVAR